MTFNAEILVHLQSITSLREDNNTKFLHHMGYNNGVSEEQRVTYAREFLSQAHELGLPSSFWFFGYYDFSLLFLLLKQPHCQQSIKMLSTAGISVWPVSLTNSASPPLTPSFMSPSRVTDFIFSTHEHPIGSCKVCFLSALSGLASTPDEIKSIFFRTLAESYFEATRLSSDTSLGVLGRADKRAKSCAALVVNQAECLRATCALVSPVDLPRVESMIADATCRLAAKDSSAHVSFDPAQLKKNLTLSQHLRLRSISTLLDHNIEDEASFSLVFDSTAWLALMPQALCVTRRSAVSVLHSALRASSHFALEKLDLLGANVWLASAQDGQANACLWVVRVLNRSIGYGSDHKAEHRASIRARVHACFPVVTHMLAYGAHLDGAVDPIAHALLKAREAQVAVSAPTANDDATRVLPLLSSLISRLEGLVLSDVLDRHVLPLVPIPTRVNRARL